MKKLGIAMDLGTSGIRTQVVELDCGTVVSTAITIAHPLPGANVIDHLHFALEVGLPVARRLLFTAINKVILGLGISIKQVSRFAVCGNGVQLSLFQGLEIRDLAFTGKGKLTQLGVVTPDRNGAILTAKEIEELHLDDRCEVIIPPAVCHGVGADGLAMILQSGLLEEHGTALITDYGTNAEMALHHEGRIITASAAAGPALEGQQLSCGLLAGPGAVTNIEPCSRSCYHAEVLDEQMLPVRGPQIELERAQEISDSIITIRGITGTGVVAVMHEALEAGYIKLPQIETPDGLLHLGQEIYLDENDLQEAGKAIGAIRAGHLTLCHEAGIDYGDVQTVYMAGATGTYVDPLKAQRIGLLPPRATTVIQVGNTSLQMAQALVMDVNLLDTMQVLATRIRKDHCMLAISETFKKIYLLELSYWTEGMPLSSYRALLARYGVGDLPEEISTPVIQKRITRDIEDIGKMGLQVITDIGQAACRFIHGCTACGSCISACPQAALKLQKQEELQKIQLDQSRCNGLSCRRCEQACPEKVMVLEDFFNTHVRASAL